MGVVEPGVDVADHDDGLPPVIACASGVWIWSMSHCRPLSESASVAGVCGRASFAPLSSVSGWRCSAFAPVEAAAATFESFSRAARKVSLDERAIATPMAG